MNKMNCKNCRNDLYGLIRGTLSKPEEIRVREHLDGCVQCRSFADYLQNTLDIITIEKNIVPDPFLSTRIEGLLASPSSNRLRAGVEVRLLSGLIFSILILIGIASGIGLGTLLSSNAKTAPTSNDGIDLMMNDLQQEPIETFLMGLDELPEK